MLLTALGGDLGTKRVPAKPHRKITPCSFCMLTCLFFGLRNCKDSGHSLCATVSLCPSGPWWPLYPLGFPCCSVLQQWRSSGSHLCNPTLLWPGEGERAGMCKSYPHSWLKAGAGRGVFIPHPAHASRGDTWARESPGLCHCSRKCHLWAPGVLMALKCIFQIFSELITLLLLRRGSVPAQAHITHRGQQSGHPRVAQGPERAELCRPPQQQEGT